MNSKITRKKLLQKHNALDTAVRTYLLGEVGRDHPKYACAGGRFNPQSDFLSPQ